jgi:hypothetical protein
MAESRGQSSLLVVFAGLWWIVAAAACDPVGLTAYPDEADNDAGDSASDGSTDGGDEADTADSQTDAPLDTPADATDVAQEAGDVPQDTAADAADTAEEMAEDTAEEVAEDTADADALADTVDEPDVVDEPEPCVLPVVNNDFLVRPLPLAGEVIAPAELSAGAGYRFGHSVAQTDEYIAAGAPQMAGIGHVVLFDLQGEVWTQIQVLVADDAVDLPPENDEFGAALAMNDTRLVIVDSAGVAYSFQLTTTWEAGTEERTFVGHAVDRPPSASISGDDWILGIPAEDQALFNEFASGTTVFENGAEGSNFGAAVSVSGSGGGGCRLAGDRHRAVLRRHRGSRRTANGAAGRLPGPGVWRLRRPGWHRGSGGRAGKRGRWPRLSLHAPDQLGSRTGPGRADRRECPVWTRRGGPAGAALARRRL